MYSFAIIGMTGQGKSAYTREALIKNNAPCLVFDVNNEYGKHDKHNLNLPTDTSLPRSRYVGGSFEEFMKIVETKRKTNVVFEEATGFLRGAIGKEIARMVINKRHTGNNYIFLFHSIRSIPPSLLDWINVVVLFDTADDLPVVEKKHIKLVKPFVKIKTREVRPPIIIKWI